VNARRGIGAILAPGKHSGTRRISYHEWWRLPDVGGSSGWRSILAGDHDNEGLFGGDAGGKAVGRDVARGAEGFDVSENGAEVFVGHGVEGSPGHGGEVGTFAHGVDEHGFGIRGEFAAQVGGVGGAPGAVEAQRGAGKDFGLRDVLELASGENAGCMAVVATGGVQDVLADFFAGLADDMGGGDRGCGRIAAGCKKREGQAKDRQRGVMEVHGGDLRK